MRLVHELTIVVMETLGMLLVSVGLGATAASLLGAPGWLGGAGLLTVTGVCLLLFAMLAALRQKSMSAPPKSATDNAGRR